MRAYARAKQIVEQTEKLDNLPDDPMVDLVQEIEFDIATEWKTKKRGLK